MARRPKRQTNPTPKPTGNIFLDSPTTTTPAPARNTRTINSGGATVTITKPPPAPAPSSNIFLGGGAATPAGPKVVTITGDKAVTAPAAPKKRDDPIRRLNIDLQKIQTLIPGLSPADQARARAVVSQNSQGTDFAKQMQAATLQSFADESAGKTNQVTIPGGMGALSAAGLLVKQVNRPVQAVESAYGALARGTHESGTWGPRLGPLALPSFSHVSPHEVTKGFYGGLALNRHDTPTSILKELATIDRNRSNDPTFARGIDKAVSTVPGGSIAFDTLIGLASDPLTYLTFGTSSAAKSSLEGVERLTTGERAAAVARSGLDVLTPAERTLVEGSLGEEGIKALERGARGGVGVRVPFGSETGRTIINTKPVSEAIREGFQTAEQTPGLLGAPARIARTVAGGAKEVFVPRASLIGRTDIGGAAVARDLNEAQAEARGFQHSRTDRLTNRLMNVMKKEDVTPLEMREVVGPALDVGGTGVVNTSNAARDVQLQRVVDRFSQVRQDLTDEQVFRGRLQPDTALGPDALTTENYFPRVRTEEGDALYNKALQESGLSSDAVGVNDPFLQARRLRPDMSVRDINTQLRSELGLGEDFQYFHEDPLLAFHQRARSAYGSMAREDFTTSLMGLRDPEGNNLVHNLSLGPNNAASLPRAVNAGPGTISEQLSQGARDIPVGHVEVEIADPLTGNRIRVAVPEEVGQLVTNTSAMLNNPEALGRMYDQMLNWWKTMATVPLPFGIGFHLRNAESNFMLNWMSGMGVSIPDYVRAGRLQMAMNRGVKQFGDWQHFLGADDRSLMQHAMDREVLSSGWYGDLGELKQKAGMGHAYSRASKPIDEQAAMVLKRAFPLSTESIWVTGGRKAGQGVEENARLAHYLAAQRVTGDYDAAAASVRKWLFDYHDVTGSEQKIKKLIPFYTWARKSTARVAETLVRDPRKLAQLNRLRDSIAQSAGVDLSNTLVPDYVRDNPTAVPLGNAGRGLVGNVLGAGQAAGTPLIGAPDTPLNTPYDVANVAYGAARAVPFLGSHLPNLGQGSEPKEALRTAVGMVGGPLGIAKAGIENLAGVNFFSGAPIRDEYVTSPRPFNWIPGQDQMTAATRNLLNAFYPTSSKIEGLFPNDPANKDKRLRRWVSTLTGLPVYAIGQKTQESEAYRRLEPVAKLLKMLQDQGQIPAG